MVADALGKELVIEIRDKRPTRRANKAAVA
jgi:hypothetical protein